MSAWRAGGRKIRLERGNDAAAFAFRLRGQQRHILWCGLRLDFERLRGLTVAAVKEYFGRLNPGRHGSRDRYHLTGHCHRMVLRFTGCYPYEFSDNVIFSYQFPDMRLKPRRTMTPRAARIGTALTHLDALSESYRIISYRFFSYDGLGQSTGRDTRENLDGFSLFHFQGQDSMRTKLLSSFRRRKTLELFHKYPLTPYMLYAILGLYKEEAKTQRRPHNETASNNRSEAYADAVGIGA